MTSALSFTRVSLNIFTPIQLYLLTISSVLTIPLSIAYCNNSLSNAERTEPLTIIGPKGLMRTVNAALTLISKLPFEIKCIECSEESTSLDLFGLKLTMFSVNHGVPCYGYSFSLARSGKCDPDKAKQNGVPPEIWTDLQHNKVIRMNGRVFTKDLIMGEERRGLKVTYTTDTRPCTFPFIMPFSIPFSSIPSLRLHITFISSLNSSE